MDTWLEQNGEGARTRKTPQYEACIDEMIAGVTPDNLYTTLDGERIDEYTLLGRLMVKAGVAWVCLNDKCRGINVHKNLTCDNCRGRKPKSRSVVEAED